MYKSRAFKVEPVIKLEKPGTEKVKELGLQEVSIGTSPILFVLFLTILVFYKRVCKLYSKC